VEFDLFSVKPNKNTKAPLDSYREESNEARGERGGRFKKARTQVVRGKRQRTRNRGAHGEKGL